MRIFLFTICFGLLSFKNHAQNLKTPKPNYYFFGGQIEYNYFTSSQIVLGLNYIGLMKNHKKIILSYDVSISRILGNKTNEFGSKVGSGITCNQSFIMLPNFKIAAERNTRFDFRIGGEVGITFIKLINLNYGFYPLIYGIGADNISINRLTITVKINKILPVSLIGP